jgi:hypothetical protein
LVNFLFHRLRKQQLKQMLNHKKSGNIFSYNQELYFIFINKKIVFLEAKWKNYMVI